jgi:hypothetical protein
MSLKELRETINELNWDLVRKKIEMEEYNDLVAAAYQEYRS